MPGVVLTTEIIDDSPIKLLKSQLAQIKRDALRELAEHFHKEYVPRRFTPGNESRYQHEPRNRGYKDRIKKRYGTGQGKYVNNLLSGKTKRRTLLAKITATQHQSTLTVETPTYFRRPFVGTFRDPESGRVKRVTRQPDKVAESIRLSPDEKRELRKYFAARVLMRIKNPPKRRIQRRNKFGQFVGS